MKPIRSALHRLLLATCLLPLAMPVQSAEPKSSQGPALTQPVAEPVQRLIIRYRDDGPKTDRAVAASAEDERVTAAAQVAHSAGLARVPGLRYLKSVSPQLHVARLDRPLPAGEVQALIERLRADPAVASVTVDQRVRPHAVPTDAYFTDPRSAYYQWHLQSPSTVPGGINAAAAWASSTGTGVTVAVLDGGYRPHADLALNLLTTNDYDFISADTDGSFWTANDGNARDANAEDPGDWVDEQDATPDCEASKSSWHGTHVTGLIGALANGVEGVGVAHGAKVLPVRVLGRCGGYLSDILAGMRWATGLSVDGIAPPATPAKVLNLSLGIAGTCDSTTQSVIDEVRARGVSVVASTGNEGLTAITKPANCAGVLAVTAHDRNGDSASYANAGTGTDLSAPGGEFDDGIASTWNDGKTEPGTDSYGLMAGTSMAAPQVVGVLALMASIRPDVSMADLEKVLLSTARPFPANTYCTANPGQCGAGLLDAGAAVAAVQTYVPVDEVPATTDSGGGCTVAPAGQADAGLPLVALAAVLALLWRRRNRVSAVRR